MSRTTCSCPDNNCFQGTCDCFIRDVLCSSGCNCRGGCQNGLSLETINPAAAQGTTPTAPAAQAAADQAAAPQAAAQPMPLPAQEPEPKSEARNTSPSAVEMKFIGYYEGCSCRKNGCHHYRCPCFTRGVGCSSKCKCPATVCVNPIGARGDESKAQPGGQGGTSGTPDEAELQPESQIVQPRDASSLVSTMSRTTCGCANRNCFQSCVCYTRGVVCSPDCKCHGGCLNSVVIRWSAAQGTASTLASGSTTAQGTSQTQPLVLSSSASQAAAQTLPSSSVVAALAPDTKTKPLPAREPGSTQKPCSCDETKCENMNCLCVSAGLACCDRCECKDCDNTKTSEVPASGSGTSAMTAGAAL